MGIIATIVGVVISVVALFPLSNNNGTSQSITISGKENVVNQTINQDNNTDELCKEGILRYEETIQELRDELKMLTFPDLRKTVEKELIENTKELRQFKINTCKKR